MQALEHRRNLVQRDYISDHRFGIELPIAAQGLLQFFPPWGLFGARGTPLADTALLANSIRPFGGES